MALIPVIEDLDVLEDTFPALYPWSGTLLIIFVSSSKTKSLSIGELS